MRSVKQHRSQRSPPEGGAGGHSKSSLTSKRQMRSSRKRQTDNKQPNASKSTESVRETAPTASTIGTASTSSVFSTRSGIQGQDALSEEEWAALARLECYHGLMPRDEIEELLEKDGDFIVRKSEKNNESCVVLSVRSKGRIRHFVLRSKQGMWWIDPQTQKNSLHDLIVHLVTSREPIFADGTVLLNGVPRPSYYLLHDQIKIKEKLGDGAFGEVFACVLTEGLTTIECAAKTLKGVMAKNKRVDFIREARLMRQMTHPNVLRVYGVAPQKEPLMILLELCPKGSLKNHLQKSSPAEVTSSDLARYCLEAACALSYLSSQQIIHRDIAARNCLLGNKFELKISDFGLAVMSDGVVYLTESVKLPTRWLSPETLANHEFSTKSDVWSYGVLMWEIYSRCRSDPYPGLHSEAVRQKILSPSLPMEPPPEMPPMQELVMRNCFVHDKRERVSFQDIYRCLSIVGTS